MPRRLAGTLVLALAVLAGAAPAEQRTPAAPTSRDESSGRASVLLLGLDGGDWDVMMPLIESGRLPNLGRVALKGARGDLDCVPAMPSTACFCPPVWVTVATGVPFERHRISGIHDVVSQRRAKAIWSILAAEGGSSTLVSYRNTWPPESDARYVFTEYGLDYASRFYFDRSGEDEKKTAGREEQVARLVAPPDLFQQLRLLPYSGARTPALAMLARDRLAMEALLRLARRERTDLTVVLLHGPDKIEHLLWKQAQPSPDVAFDASVVLAQAEAWPGPRARLGPGPKTTLVSPYLEIDAWLGELLAEVHYDYVVLASDHGMAPNDSDEGLAGVHGRTHSEAHRGIFAVIGPGVEPGRVIEGATVLDVAPTLAYLLGLPIAEDRPGRVLDSALNEDWREVHPARSVASWEPAPGARPARKRARPPRAQP